MTDLSTRNTQRIAAIDWMRGIVMILMVLDHTSWFFNTQRIFADSVLLYEAGRVWDTDQFLTRWITHICAPSFVFLAGTAMAISVAQRIELGMTHAQINRDLQIRGAFIACLDLFVLSLASGKIVLQVLYAIGISMILMVPLRRLGRRAILVIALIILLGGEALLAVLWHPDYAAPLWLALTWAPVLGDSYTVLYPVLPWLAIMMLGWVFGEWLMARQADPGSIQWRLLLSGIAAVLGFILIRSADGYGNMFMPLQDNSMVQWLLVSKYPPSLAYVLLELGLMAIILAALMRLETWIDVRHNNPVLVYGQTALFFYLAHFCILAVLKPVLDQSELMRTCAITLLVLILLYPLCRFYRTLKWRNPRSVLRFL